MGLQVSLDKALRFTKMSVYLARSWPPSKNLTKWDSKKLDIIWFLSILSSLGLLVPLLISIYKNQSSSLILTQSACFVGAICNFIVKMIVYRIHRKRTQVKKKCEKKSGNHWPENVLCEPQILINEMEDFLKTAEPHEIKLLQSYVNRSSTFHAVITFVNYMTTAVVMCGPLFLPQRFPTAAIYPFSVDSRLATYVVYIHQSFVGFQCSTGATIDCQTAVMMWYAGARLELLAIELKNVSGIAKFRCFVQKHQRLLWYASEVSCTMRYIALTTSIMSGLGTVFSGLQLLSNQPFAVKMQFGPVVLVAGMNLLVCAWPADNLIKVCHLMGTAVYNTAWIDLSSRMMKNHLMILRRSQRPVIVSVGGFLPTLSLRSYATYLSTAFSYTTTLRIIVSSDSNN